MRPQRRGEARSPAGSPAPPSARPSPASTAHRICGIVPTAHRERRRSRRDISAVREANPQRQPRAVDHAGEHIAAEPDRCRTWNAAAGGRNRKRIRIAIGSYCRNDRRQQRRQHHNADNGEADPERAVPGELSQQPVALPRGLSCDVDGRGCRQYVSQKRTRGSTTM